MPRKRGARRARVFGNRPGTDPCRTAKAAIATLERRTRAKRENAKPDHPRKWDAPFKADAPDQLWVADFTYVYTAMGAACAAFVIDTFTRKIIGWRVPTSMTTSLVLVPPPLNQALCQRRPPLGALTHHSDPCMQYVSIRYAERLGEARSAMSVGSVGDNCDNALAETDIG